MSRFNFLFHKCLDLFKNHTVFRNSFSSRPAFTMIELVFIIVILGILASIAVPKMAASRDNALVVSLKNDIETFMQAVPAYAMSRGFRNDDGTLIRLSDVGVLSPEIWRVARKGPQHQKNPEDTSLAHTRNVESVFGKGEDSCATMRIVEKKDTTVGFDNKGGPFLEIWINGDDFCSLLNDIVFITEGPIKGAPTNHTKHTEYIELTGISVKL